jgi:hypothetical protein
MHVLARIPASPEMGAIPRTLRYNFCKYTNSCTLRQTRNARAAQSKPAPRFNPLQWIA